MHHGIAPCSDAFGAHALLALLLGVLAAAPAAAFTDFYKVPEGMEAVQEPVPAPQAFISAPASMQSPPVQMPSGSGSSVLGRGIPALGQIGDAVTSATPIAGSPVSSAAVRQVLPATASSNPGAACIAAIRAAEERHGIPRNLLLAIGLQEAGTKRDGQLTVWPWVVNSHGQGRIFDTRAEAESFVDAERAAGRNLIDVGCMQVNLRWHPEAFAGISDGFDPVRNADYAARFLVELRSRSGDWMEAAGNYHSYTPENHNRYVAGLRKNLVVAEARAAEFDAVVGSASFAKNTVAAAPGMGEYSVRRIARLQPGGFRRQLERVAAKGGLVETPPALQETPAEPMPAGPWWSAEMSTEGARAGRSIYSREDLEPVLPVLQAISARAGGTAAENP